MFRIFKTNYSKFCPHSHIKKVSAFHLQMPQIISGFEDKIVLRYLKKILPEEYFDDVIKDCGQFSRNLETKWFHLHQQCESNPPFLIKNDSWGKKVDQIVTCDSWKILKDISSKEGLIALPYENNHGQFSRVYQCIKLMMFAPLSGLYSCPLAMTDGAAFVIKKLEKSPLLTDAFLHLTSRDPLLFWTSGQWMTEKRGGSDVAEATETVALLDTDSDCYRLYGSKWFCSATDADMVLTLARSVNNNNIPIPGSKGLSLYYLKTKSQEKNSVNIWNNLSIVNLKDKLGTRQLPTAEVLLEGSRAIKLSEDGRGISSISGMLTITRIHNAIAAVSAMRRITMLAIDYAKKRISFGSELIKKPLHCSTLAQMDIESRAAFYFMIDVVHLLGLQENRLSNEEDNAVLRILSPLLKLYTAKQAVSVVSEGLECFGGQGFIEGTGLPGMLRDAQVLPIWEGTTNVLSLDTIRSLNLGSKEAISNCGNLFFFINRCKRKLNHDNHLSYPQFHEQLNGALEAVERFIAVNHYKPHILQFNARHLSYSLSKIYMGVLLLENARAPEAHYSDELSLQYWMKKDLVFGLSDPNSSNIVEVNWNNFFE